MTVVYLEALAAIAVSLAILMALAVVREKELGSITNLYVTPVTRLEFLVGKQLPYVAVAMINFPAQQFSGMMTPVSSLSGTAQLIGLIFPMTYYRPISVGTFTKGLGFSDLTSSILLLILFIPVLTVLSLWLLPKQER